MFFWSAFFPLFAVGALIGAIGMACELFRSAGHRHRCNTNSGDLYEITTNNK
jgi:hypothetical protein